MTKFATLRLIALLALSLFTGTALAAGLEGKPAPEFSLADASGQQHDLAELARGRPAIVLFWASWCPYCEALMPHLQALHAREGDRVAVIAIDLWEDDRQDAIDAVARRGIDFTVLYHGDKQAAKWGVKGTPGLFVIDATGKVVFDRNARPLTTADLGEAAAKDRASGIARSAELWAAAVERALAPLLKASETR